MLLWLFLLQLAPPVPTLRDGPDSNMANAGGLPTAMGAPLPPHLALKAGKGLSCTHSGHVEKTTEKLGKRDNSKSEFANCT